MNKRSNHWITGLTLALCALATGAGAQGSATADFIDNVASAEYLDGAGGDRRQAESNRARIPFNSEIALTLVKTSGDRNGDTLRPGERLDYRITLDSSGAAPPSRSLRVDGADALGVLLADTVPAWARSCRISSPALAAFGPAGSSSVLAGTVSASNTPSASAPSTRSDRDGGAAPLLSSVIR